MGKTLNCFDYFTESADIIALTFYNTRRQIKTAEVWQKWLLQNCLISKCSIQILQLKIKAVPMGDSSQFVMTQMHHETPSLITGFHGLFPNQQGNDLVFYKRSISTSDICYWMHHITHDELENTNRDQNVVFDYAPIKGDNQAIVYWPWWGQRSVGFTGEKAVIIVGYIIQQTSIQAQQS